MTSILEDREVIVVDRAPEIVPQNPRLRADGKRIYLENYFGYAALSDPF
jgi:hypothetical protein